MSYAHAVAGRRRPWIRRARSPRWRSSGALRRWARLICGADPGGIARRDHGTAPGVSRKPVSAGYAWRASPGVDAERDPRRRRSRSDAAKPLRGGYPCRSRRIDPSRSAFVSPSLRIAHREGRRCTWRRGRPRPTSRARLVAENHPEGDAGAHPLWAGREVSSRGVPGRGIHLARRSDHPALSQDEPAACEHCWATVPP